MQIWKSVFCETSCSKTVTLYNFNISCDSLMLFVYTTRCNDDFEPKQGTGSSHVKQLCKKLRWRNKTKMEKKGETKVMATESILWSIIHYIFNFGQICINFEKCFTFHLQCKHSGTFPNRKYELLFSRKNQKMCATPF